MEIHLLLIIGILFLCISILYSTVGHGGASGYIATMALLALPLDLIRPTALTLNIFVAGLATARFASAGYLSLKSAIPFVAISVPLAFVGGSISLPEHIYRPVLGILLIISAFMITLRIISDHQAMDVGMKKLPVGFGLCAGGIIGFLSGLTGIGGGIFLSPLLILSRWMSLRQTSAIAAIFILLNSTAGLIGSFSNTSPPPKETLIWALIVLLGAWIGTSLGTRLLPTIALAGILVIALLAAGIKFLYI